MRLSIKRSLIGVLAFGALAATAVVSEANGNANGPDAYIGIVGGSPQEYTYSANGNNQRNGYGAYDYHAQQNYRGGYVGGYHQGY
jgi:hypothetical protein